MHHARVAYILKCHLFLNCTVCIVCLIKACLIFFNSFQSSKSDIVHFSFDTPESKIDRHVAVDINLNKKDYTLDMTLTSPWNKANFQGNGY